MPRLCDYKDLPAVEGHPPKAAWGFYASGDPSKDQLGRLNLLTPEVVQAAAQSQIKTGLRVQLDWPLNNVQFPSFGRQTFTRTTIDISNPDHDWIGCDDKLLFNTQTSSQWDGYRHKAHPSGRYYNGHTHETVLGGNDELGIDKWCKAGGIAGRGVLLDWVRWYQHANPGKELPYPCAKHAIPLEELLQVAQYQGTTFQVGDILIIRSGFVRWHNEASEDERRKGTAANTNYIGVEQTPQSLEWFWNNHFAAVAGDTMAFEAYPPVPGGISFHEHFISLWGMPIGEMWDLETLSQVCEAQGRWTFFLTSAPLHSPGGVASPPNAIAIF